MIDHHNKRKKPCKTGDLISNSRSGLFLVLDIKWDSGLGDWLVHLVSQQSGRKFHYSLSSLQAELDEGLGAVITQQSQEDTEK